MRYLYNNMEIDRELLDIETRLFNINGKIGDIDNMLAKYEQAIDDRVVYNARYGNQEKYSDRLYIADNGYSWKWEPTKKEYQEYKRNKIYNFFINYDENDNGIRLKWLPFVERIKQILVQPGYVYFNHYEAIIGVHARTIYLDRPTIIKNIFVKPEQVVNQGDDVLSVEYIDIDEKLEQIINASKLKCLAIDKFKKLVAFYNWCKDTNRYSIIAAKTICESPLLLNPTVQFEELYDDIIHRYAMYNPTFMATSKSRIPEQKPHLKPGVTVRM